MEIFLIKALQLILCLSILIILHEGGHFFFAKLFGIRVEKFYLFFDYKFKLFSTYRAWWRKLCGKQPVEKDEKGEPKYCGTEYGIGWIPLGGYVKIAGMIDESMDTEQMSKDPQPWEFRTKPAWQRLLVMLGGVMVNFVLALLIYSMILFAWGESYVPAKDVTMGYTFNEQAHKLGFQEGDILIAADGEEFRSFDINVIRTVSNAKQITVLRQGNETNIAMPEGGQSLLDMLNGDRPFLALNIPSVIDSVMPDTPAALAKVAKGDTVVAFNDTPVRNWTDYNAATMALSKSLEGATTNDSLRKRNVTVVLSRANTGVHDTISLTLRPDLKMGVAQASALTFYKPTTKEYSFAESFPAGIKHGIAVFSGYVNDLKYLFTKEGAKSVGSFGAIGSMFPEIWNWQRFWELTAFISIILAFMNVLPIPALDGGHALFLILEMVFRRKFSLKFQERAQMVGMAILLLLMVYAIGNDIFRFLL